MDYWLARTDTGRPRTPIFSLGSHVTWQMSADEAREFFREKLDEKYAEAHPNGCG